MIRLIDALEPRRLLAFSPIQLGEKGLDAGYSTAVDAQGNTIVAGIFQHTLDLGLDPNGTHAPEAPAPHLKITAVGETDIFIAKFDPSGNVIWAGNIGGEESKLDKKPNFAIDPSRLGSFVGQLGPTPQTLGETLGGIAVDSSGNVFVGGSFLKIADLDPGPGKLEFNADHQFGQYTDAFLIKIDPTGGLVWADQIGGEFNDVVNAVSVDPAGNPVVTGYFTRSADFDPTNKGVFTLNALGRDDIFVAKYTGAGGKLVWADGFGGDQTKPEDRDTGNAITVDSLGNVFVTGTFGGDTYFDPGPSEVIVKPRKNTDAFVLELSPRGKRVMDFALSGKGFDGGMGIAVRNGEIYTASYFNGTLDVDPGPATLDLTSFGDDRHTDILISKYTAAGKLEWAKPIGGDGFETIGGFGVASDGSVYTSGGFYDSVDFDPGPGTDIITSTVGDDNFDDPNDNGRDNSYDVFVSRLSTNGKFLGATTFGSSGDDFGGGLSFLPSGDVTLTGQFRNTVSFATAGGTKKLKTRGSTDAFLIELDPTQL